MSQFLHSPAFNCVQKQFILDMYKKIPCLTWIKPSDSVFVVHRLPMITVFDVGSTMKTEGELKRDGFLSALSLDMFWTLFLYICLIFL